MASPTKKEIAVLTGKIMLGIVSVGSLFSLGHFLHKLKAAKERRTREIMREITDTDIDIEIQRLIRRDPNKTRLCVYCPHCHGSGCITKDQTKKNGGA